MEGYMKNAIGHLVPIETVEPIDKLRDEMVRDLVKEGLALKEQLAKFKKKAFLSIDDFVSLSATEYEVVIGGPKGNLNLVSYDGEFKITRAVATNITFDERLQVAKELIDECLKDWSSTSGPELRTIVNGAFKVDSKGDVNVKSILSLRKHRIEDPRWKKAMKAISDSITVTGSKSYIRIYKRSGDTGEDYAQIPLDLASV